MYNILTIWITRQKITQDIHVKFNPEFLWQKKSFQQEEDPFPANWSSV
jgi:hypothetical protein